MQGNSLLLALAILVLVLVVGVVKGQTIYDFRVQDASNNEVALTKFEAAKVLVIVNVASNCGYTYTNYRELAVLHEKYSPQGLEIIGFPSNQFGEQEPGTNEEIQKFVSNYGIKFPVMAKVDVNGPGAIELFNFLREKTGQSAINWNFNKFLVVDGQPIKRYPGSVKPSSMEQDIRRLLGIDEEAGSDL